MSLILNLLFVAALSRPASGEEDVHDLLSALRGVGPEGAGSTAAADAWRKLARLEAGELPRLLAALDGAGPLAANWIRSAADAVAERTLAERKVLPVKALEAFLLDTRHDPRGRRFAFELLKQADASAAERLIPQLLHDPSVEFRRDAVERLERLAGALEAAGSRAEALAAYQKAFDASRDLDQIEALTKKLRGLGASVDLARHFGFVREWRLLGPFDNTAKAGFARVYTPENGAGLDGASEGKHGPVAWREVRTDDEYGAVDLNKALQKEKAVAAYALAEFVSDRARDVEIRLGTLNAWKLWLNGEFLFGREEYHHGTKVDHYRVPARLKAGPNEILLKVCQNEQTEDWAETWGFQLRVCDAVGTAVLPLAPQSRSEPSARSSLEPDAAPRRRI
jgi:hypothetical protein